MATTLSLPPQRPVIIRREIPLSWEQDLMRANRLKDGDVVECSAEDLGDPSRLEIHLNLAAHKSWWKGIEVCADDDSRVGMVEVQDNRKSASMGINVIDIRTGGRLYLWKAKTFGVHTRMYVIDLSPMHGKRVHFTWTAD